MRRLRFTPEAETTFANQLDYLVEHGAQRAANVLLATVEHFLTTTLVAWPKTGRYIAEREIWESWIPRTRLVVWYTFDDVELVVLSIWHVSQDRHST